MFNYKILKHVMWHNCKHNQEGTVLALCIKLHAVFTSRIKVSLTPVCINDIKMLHLLCTILNCRKNGKIIWIRCDNYQDVTDSKLNLKTRKAISVCYVLYDDTKCAHNYVKYGLLDKHLASHSSCTNQCYSFCQNSTIYLCQIVGQLYQLIRPLWPYSIVTLVERFVL